MPPPAIDRYQIPHMLGRRAVRRFHVMAKPAGSACNLDCSYCFYLSKQTLHGGPGGGHMDDELLERFVRDYIASVTGDEVVFSWQGGEPTQVKFGYAKSEKLPAYCRRCEFLADCWGECPKNRLLRTPDGEPGLNYLCPGLKRFFAHAVPAARKLAARLGAAHSPVVSAMNAGSRSLRPARARFP